MAVRAVVGVGEAAGTGVLGVVEPGAMGLKLAAVVDAGNYSMNKKDVIYRRNKGKKAGLIYRFWTIMFAEFY